VLFEERSQIDLTRYLGFQIVFPLSQNFRYQEKTSCLSDKQKSIGQFSTFPMFAKKPGTFQYRNHKLPHHRFSRLRFLLLLILQLFDV